jgi:hypothetical protein
MTKNQVLTLWYVYECIYTCNLNITEFSDKEKLLLDLEQAVDFKPTKNTLWEIEYELQDKFNLRFNDYWEFKKSDSPLISNAYNILFPESLISKKEINEV